MVKTLVAIPTVLLAFSFLASAQGVSPKPKFDVASVKECTPADRGGQSRTSPGGLSFYCWSVKTLIQQAYAVFGSGKTDLSNPGAMAFPVEGFPTWANSTRYSIEAKTDSPQSPAMMRGPMMQALFEERFGLKVHVEKREVPVYFMTVNRGQNKLHETPEGTCESFDFADLSIEAGERIFCGVPQVTRTASATIMDYHGMTLGAFSKFLQPDGRPVIDQTGLTGKYEIHLEMGSASAEQPAGVDGVASAPSLPSSLVVALREQLGLQLTSGRAMRDFLVIDHIEKATEN